MSGQALYPIEASYIRIIRTFILLFLSQTILKQSSKDFLKFNKLNFRCIVISTSNNILWTTSICAKIQLE